MDKRDEMADRARDGAEEGVGEADNAAVGGSVAGGSGAGGSGSGESGAGETGAGGPETGGRSSAQGEHKRLVGTLEQSKLDPYEIAFLPEFTEGRGPRQPFVNEHGVVIGDHEYVSPNSPLENWSDETDPAVMAGDQWVHPYKDIGFHTAENKVYFEKGIPPQGGLFAHPMYDAARNMDGGRADGADEAEARYGDGNGGDGGGGGLQTEEGPELTDGGGCRE